MNDPAGDSSTCALLTHALLTHADSAPRSETLLADVRHRIRRRRRAQAAGVGVLACTAVAATMTAVGVLRDGPVPAAAPSSVPVHVPADSAEDGWHWESYKTVQVQVPDSWKDTLYTHLWTCPSPGGYGPALPRPPLVGRAYRGAVPMKSCGPVSPLAERVPHLWLGESNRSPGVYRYDHGWLEEVRIVNGVHLSAFGNDPVLLRRILDSAVPIDGKDAYGCSPTAPAVLTDGLRPTGAGLDGVGEVESVQICGYNAGGRPPGKELLASGAITGDLARQLVRALRTGPAGNGPNHEYHCHSPQLRDDLLVTVRGKSGEQQLSVRYSTCNQNGIDDGTTSRQLTRDALLPLVRALYAPRDEPMITERLPR